MPPKDQRSYDYKRRYGITIKQYEEILKSQNYRCAICRNKETVKYKGKTKPLAVDHSHEFGTVRGLLCNNCNAVIGMAKDNYGILERAIEYLKTERGEIFSSKGNGIYIKNKRFLK